MLRNRDINRKNRANLAVQACLYSKINTSSLTKLEKMLNCPNSINSESAKKLIEIAQSSNKSMVDCFTRSQNEISKNTCINYANEQFGLFSRGVTNGEQISDNDNFSKHIITGDIVDMYMKMDNDIDVCKFSIR